MDERVKGYFRDNHVRSNKRICSSDITSKSISVRKTRTVSTILKSSRGFLSGKIIQATEEALVIQYHKDQYMQSILQAIKKWINMSDYC